MTTESQAQAASPPTPGTISAPTARCASALACAAPGRRYLLVTPCRDEAEYLPATIRTIAAQSLSPACWVVVDDGSSDATPQILAEAARTMSFLKIVRREDRGVRSVGPGVIDAFYAGLDRVNLEEFDYVCKLDGDLELPPRYFEGLIEAMEREPRLGTFSGKMYVRQPDGSTVHEERGDENSCGPSKFYRVACFRETGGFVRHVGWDGIDGHVCRLKGWIARSEDRPDLRVIHLRALGSSHKGLLHGRMRGGAGNWYIGMSLPYMLARTLYRLKDPPFARNAFAVLWGYLKARFRGEPSFGDADYRRYLSRFEWSSLVRGKNRTVRRLHDEIRTRYGGGKGAAASGGSFPRRRILAVASGGGHWVQLQRLKPAFDGHDVTFVTVNAAYQSDVPGFAFETIRDATRWNKLGLLVVAWQLWRLLRRIRPDVVISTGAAPGFLALRLGRMLGARTVWIDSIANAEELSLAGRKAGRVADLWLTQWAHLARPDGPHYRGAVL